MMQSEEAEQAGRLEILRSRLESELVTALSMQWNRDRKLRSHRGWRESDGGEQMVLFVARRQLETWDECTQRSVMRLNKATCAEFLPRLTHAAIDTRRPCSLAGAAGLRDLWLYHDRNEVAGDHILDAQLVQCVHLTSLRAFTICGPAPGYLREHPVLQLPASLTAVRSVSELRISDIAPTGLHHLASFSHLASLYLYNCRLDLCDLPALPSLLTLGCERHDGRVDMQGLAARQSGLQSLSMSGGGVVLEHFESLEVLTSLQHLMLQFCRLDSGEDLGSLNPVSSLTALTSLRISHAGATSLEALAALTQLQVLDLRCTRPFQDLTPLKSMHSLRRLVLHATDVKDISPLSGLHNLRHLDLAGTEVNELSPLAQLSALERLNITFCRLVQSVAPLAGLTGLRHLSMMHCSVTDGALLSGREHLRVIGDEHNEGMPQG